MLDLLTNPITFQILSLAGALSAILGSIIAGLAYRGKQGEAYSLLNHFISELGEVGVSRLAWVFNLGLMISGLCLIPASVSLGLLLPGVWSKLGMAAGIVTAVSIGLVGVFPMNKRTPHIRAAVTYFRIGLLMIGLFTAAIALQPDPPHAAASAVAGGGAGDPGIQLFPGVFAHPLYRAGKSAGAGGVRTPALLGAGLRGVAAVFDDRAVVFCHRAGAVRPKNGVIAVFI